MQIIETHDGRQVAMESFERVLSARRSQGIPTRFLIDNPLNGDIAGPDGGYVEAFDVDEAWNRRAAESIGGGVTPEQLKANGYRIRVYLVDLI